METQPKKLIVRILEFAVMLVIAAFLIRLAVFFILDIWWVLLVLAAVAAVIAALYRAWKNKTMW